MFGNYHHQFLNVFLFVIVLHNISYIFIDAALDNKSTTELPQGVLSSSFLFFF